MIGGQVIIEPGQSDAKIDALFKALKDNGMKMCRIRMFGIYMVGPNNTWNFDVFDKAFRAADKYGIKVYATLFPKTPITDTGGRSFPRTEAHKKEIEEYIRNVVPHFSQYKCLIAWVLVNEPGTEVPFNQEFTAQKFKEWLAVNGQPDFTPEGAPLANFDADNFARDYHTWQLQWLADQVRLYDKKHELHVNPHGIFDLVRVYDFPAWRKFLSSLGGSAHANWHFTMFPRNRFDIAMSATSEIIRSGAGELPWFMTELPGGNSIYNGSERPMNPIHEETTQWLWIVLATEAKGAIFWSLNARSAGPEAGECAMLNYRLGPTEWTEAAKKVSDCVQANPALFSKLRVCESGLNIIYTRETAWVERARNGSRPKNMDSGRSPGGNRMSTISFFETFSQMGYQANFKEIHEFDFSKNDYSGQVIILSQQIAFTPEMIADLEKFVAKGGMIIADGLTGYYDQFARCRVMDSFWLQKLFGGYPDEFKMIADDFDVNIGKFTLPANLWRGYLVADGAEVIGKYNDTPIALRNKYGKGEVVWVASPVALGVRRTEKYGDFAAWLNTILPAQVKEKSFRFAQFESNLFLKTVRNGDVWLSVIINKDTVRRQATVHTPEKLKSSLFFSNKSGSVNGNVVSVEPEETVVVKWTK